MAYRHALIFSEPRLPQSLELYLHGFLGTIVAEAGQILHDKRGPDDNGIDAEIEFRTPDGEASGQRIYLQLKCGKSHLKHRKKDGKEILTVKSRHLTYWTNHPSDVYLVVLAPKAEILWMNVTEYLRRREDKDSRQLEFCGSVLDWKSLLKLRDETLKRTEEE